MAVETAEVRDMDDVYIYALCLHVRERERESIVNLTVYLPLRVYN